LQGFEVSNNRLIGNVPSVPTPNALVAGFSGLCPNALNHTLDLAWNYATGQAPWYANCTIYSVTYDGNGSTGGSVPTDAATYPTGGYVAVLGNTGSLVRLGYSFAGWNTAANGSGTSYAGGVTFTMGSGNVILYAKWTQFLTYSVTYNSNGSTGGSVPTDGNAYVAGDTITVRGNTGSLVKTGYTFAGWNTAANGSGTSYAGGATFTMGSSNVTLYAKWTHDITPILMLLLFD
jgi:uncharacterized repeat protein (TIGR02543 family)